MINDALVLCVKLVVLLKCDHNKRQPFLRIGEIKELLHFPLTLTDNPNHLKICYFQFLQQGLFQQFWEKAPGQNWEKMIDLTSKLGEINDIEHYKGSKILS